MFGDLDKVLESQNNPLVCLREARDENRLPELFMACGKDDFVLEGNRKAKKALDEMGIPVQYYEGEGAHDWKFWNDWLTATLHWLLGKAVGEALPASYVNS